MTKKIDLHEVVNILVGPIEPIGCSETDIYRLKNISALSDLIDDLVADIYQVANSYKNSHQSSVAKVGEEAQKCLDGISDYLK